MARQHKKPAKVAASDPDKRRRNVEQLIESGKIKEAFKEAKLYFHQEASPENRQLVERTYVLRIQSLIGSGMVSAGREVASSLLEFGVRDKSLTQELILLLPQLGLADKALAMQEQSHSPEMKAQLLIKLADRAVFHPEQTPASLPELRDSAGRVRSALAALDSNNETEALELLQQIPRSSPMADWRYFTRGLIAFRHNDLEQANANWERLDSQRAARKIARVLLAASDRESISSDDDRLKVLELAAFGERILGRLADLSRAMEANDWQQALQLIGPLTKSLERIDPRLAQRLTNIVLSRLGEEIKRQSYREAQRLIKDFRAALLPLPWDPQWNRFQALLWEGSRQGSLDEAIAYWRRYLNDLEQGASSHLGDARQVQALVWRRIGELHSDMGSDEEFQGSHGGHARWEKMREDNRASATEALQKSLLLDPRRRKTYEVLIENYGTWDRPDLLVATFEELLKAFPDDVEALYELIGQYQFRDEPEPVLKYTERLRALRPLDPALGLHEAWGRLGLARHLALKNRWDEGRGEFSRVETSLREHVRSYGFLARRAAFEFKAGEAERAEEYIEQARPTLSEPTVLWLSLAIEAVRYELPESYRQRFNREFETALARKPTSQTAGEIAELMSGYFLGRVDYAGRADHLLKIVHYIGRSTRLKFREPDLRQVCLMIKLADNQEKLLTTFAKRGLKLFPLSPYFIMMDAEEDLSKGPAKFRAPKTRKKLEKALALAEISHDPEDARWIPAIKGLLARVEDLGEMMGALPFMRGSMGKMPEELFDMLASLFDNSDEMDADFDDEEPEPNRPKPPSRRKPR